MRKARKNYSPQEKIALLRAHLLDKVPTLRLCDQFQLQPTVFYRWLKQFFDNGTAALTRQPIGSHSPNARQRRIDFLQKQLEARKLEARKLERILISCWAAFVTNR